jgi:hypothetical protein
MRGKKWLFFCLWEPRQGSKILVQAWLGFLGGLKHSLTPFSLILFLISLIFARILVGCLLVVEEHICDSLEGILKVSIREWLEGRLKAAIVTFNHHWRLVS